MHRRYVIDAPVARLAVPVLVIRGRDDVLSSGDWGAASPGRQPTVTTWSSPTGTFPWGHPSAWWEPVPAFAGRLS
ncbi:hypothetical protein AB0I37_30490 [Micromonospora purpureochromogenes]|uniref:hypothetical protein n=1 Tax=Micromonospora purpureochromogenes TaxID=47872 RepID=UPI0033C2E4A5